MAAYALSFIDRQILNLLAQSIKTDLWLTDVQLSYLQGIFFALFYTVMAFRWASPPTDYVFRDEQAVRYSLVAFDAVVAPIALIILWAGMPAFKRAAIEARGWTRTV